MNLTEKLRNRSFWIRIILVASTLISIAVSAFQLLKLKSSYELLTDQEIKLKQLSASILYLDEVLTMSTNMSALTGDPKWQKRYEQYVSQLNKTIEGVYILLPEECGISSNLKIDSANKVLISLEEKAFIEIEQGNLKNAQAILKGNAYNEQKKNYSVGIKSLLSAINESILKKSTQFDNQIRIVFSGLAISFVCLFLIWILLINRLNKEKARKQEALFIKKSLAEKETLLQEIHHRVKNNLQIISSLIKLQSRAHNREQEIFFSDLQNRINSMGLIHQMLYSTNNLSSIDYEGYLQRHISNLIYSMKKNNSNVSVDIDVGGLMLDIKTATPLSLLINEIVTNSLKHGKLDNASGRIYIKIETLEHNSCQLLIGDNGVGLTDDDKTRYHNSLGFSLIQSLTEQLDGDLKFDTSKKGTHFIIHFHMMA